jgi:predicted cupin superfamily sugar epimerase
MQNNDAMAEEWKNSLGLIKHPEGGWFAEVYRSEGLIDKALLKGHGDARPFMTSIYFMLAPGEVSRLHRLKSDEIWYHHAGASLVVHQISEAGDYFSVCLGSDCAAGQQFQLIVKAGVWFGATVNGDEPALVGCAVAPGFDFADFELGRRAELLARFPRQQQIIELLTKD